MIYSVIPSLALFSDPSPIRHRSCARWQNTTVEVCEGRIERIISTNPHDFLKYDNLLGRELPKP